MHHMTRDLRSVELANEAVRSNATGTLTPARHPIYKQCRHSLPSTYNKQILFLPEPGDRSATASSCSDHSLCDEQLMRTASHPGECRLLGLLLRHLVLRRQLQRHLVLRSLLVLHA